MTLVFGCGLVDAVLYYEYQFPHFVEESGLTVGDRVLRMFGRNCDSMAASGWACLNTR